MVRHVSQGLRWAALAATGIALASCSAGVTVSRAEGVVSGTASSCARAKSVTIVVLADGAVQTSSTIHSGARFAFHLSPGHYVLTTGRLYSHVTLGAGAAVTVDFVPVCAGGST